tara:strand:- start:175 stop:447 length:273 start_codon:yes stop_codon:yes gene_type:complete
MHKPGDVVLVRCPNIVALPIQVKLLEKESFQGYKGKYINFPPYVGWHSIITNKKDCDILRKDWNIPFQFPKERSTFVFEEDILHEVNKEK